MLNCFPAATTEQPFASSVSDFTKTMADAGIVTHDPIFADGKLHRIHVEGDKPGSQNGWYILFADGVPAGKFGCWRREISDTWSAKPQHRMTAPEKSAYVRQMKTAAGARKSEQRRVQADAAERAASILAEAPPAPIDHGYLVQKRVGAHGMRLYKDLLVVPLRDADGALHSLQQISAKGEKRFLVGGRVAGCCHVIGEPQDGAILILCEGYATGASIYEATGRPVVVAFNAGNLKPVAKAWWAKLPNAKFVLAADNDQWTDGNPGLAKAIEAAKAVGGIVVVPRFKDTSGEPTDFNDLCRLEGNEAVRVQLAPPAKETSIDSAAIPAIITTAVKAAAIDTGALFETDVLEALADLYGGDLPAYMRLRSRIKQECKGVQLGELDRAVRRQRSSGETDDRSTADQIVELIRNAAELFHDPDGVAYVVFDHGERRETWPIESRGFSEWIARQAYTELGVTIREQMLREVALTLSGIAKFEGDCRTVNLRVARCGTGYYIDLCDESWRAVHVTPNGWSITDKPPVHFIRREAMRPLPVPVRGGQLDDLWNLTNFSENDHHLLVAWMLEALRADTPFPVLELCGEQGACKSTSQEYIRRLLDPNKSNLRSAPKDREALFVAARNGHVVSFENVSHLSDDLQDALCVLATGGGFSTRRFYSNEDESIIEVCRPVMLNGIAAIATRQDLVDRILHIDLEQVPESRRRTEADMEAAFEQKAPGILGALLDLFAKSLEFLPTVRLQTMPRMADFALFGAAVYKALGRTEAEFMRDYAESRRQSILRTLDASPVAVAIQAFVAKHPEGKTATVAELMDAVTHFRPQGEPAWPKSPKGFGDAMRRTATALRAIGIEVKHEAGASRREGIIWSIRPAKPGDEHRAPAVHHVSPRMQEKGRQVHQVHDVHGTPASDAAEVII